MHQRCLRSYERLAHIDHGDCSLCDLPIWTGDYYGAYVWTYGKKLWTEKFHIGCPIDPDGEDIERNSRKTERVSKAA